MEGEEEEERGGKRSRKHTTPQGSRGHLASNYQTSWRGNAQDANIHSVHIHNVQKEK